MSQLSITNQTMQFYLIFTIGESVYGIPASVVQEIFWLPEITPVEEAPYDIVGVINLRGDIIPIMDVNLRFGHTASEYLLTDIIIVLEWQEFRGGIIVNKVDEVQAIAPENIKKSVNYRIPQENGQHQSHQPEHHFIIGMAKVNNKIIQLIDTAKLLEHSQADNLGWQDYLLDLKNQSDSSTNLSQDDTLANFSAVKDRMGINNLHFGHQHHVFLPNIKPEERPIFQQRSNNLIQLSNNEDLTGFVAMAVIGLNGEYFGINLDKVREFTDIHKVTPVPCTPNYIVGNMNLRGEILTLIDIRDVLNMPLGELQNTSKAIIVQVDDIVTGLVVDEVFDVAYLNTTEMTIIPAGVQGETNEYLRGTVPYRDKMVSILDLPKIFVQGELIVEDNV